VPRQHGPLGHLVRGLLSLLGWAVPVIGSCRRWRLNSP